MRADLITLSLLAALALPLASCGGGGEEEEQAPSEPVAVEQEIPAEPEEPAGPVDTWQPPLLAFYVGVTREESVGDKTPRELLDDFIETGNVFLPELELRWIPIGHMDAFSAQPGNPQIYDQMRKQTDSYFASYFACLAAKHGGPDGEGDIHVLVHTSRGRFLEGFASDWTIDSVAPGQYENTGNTLEFRLDEPGRERFIRLASNNIGHPLFIVVDGKASFSIPLNDGMEMPAAMYVPEYETFDDALALAEKLNDAK